MAKRIDSVKLLPLDKLDLLGFLVEMPPYSDDANFNSPQRKYWQDLFARFSYYLDSFDGDCTIFQKWEKHYLERIDANVTRYLRKHLRIDSSKIPKHFADQSYIDK